MKMQTLLKAGLVISLLTPASVGAQTSGRPDGMRFVPDVRNQFRDLTEYPEALAFHMDGSPDPSSCKHYQGITRVDGPDGTPFFLVTRSGNTPPINNLPDAEVCNDSPGETGNGHLVVFRMGSRDKDGERLRSNRLRKGIHVDDTAPPQEDAASIYFTVMGGNPRATDPAKRPRLLFRDGNGTAQQRAYQHPGGMQLVGNILAMAVETPRDPTLPRSQIMFFDLSDPKVFDATNPRAPAFKSQFAPINGQGEVLAGAGVLGVTPLPGGRYLMMVTGETNTTWFFYRSTLTDLSSPNLSWDFIGSHPGPGVPGSNLSSVTDAHQTLQFLREGNISGNLYLAGARGKFLSNNDRIDLYQVTCATPEECHPGEDISITEIYKGRRITPYPSTGNRRLANLAAATSFHVTPSGELLFYATEHDNDGPDGTVQAGEWRHINMVRAGSPTLAPTALVNGPYEVDEGSGVGLSGAARPPTTRAWIQLFEEPNFGGVDFASVSVVVDYNDFALDDFDDFFFLDFEPLVPPLSDKARSWKWFAPVGCSIFAMDHHDGSLAEARTLVGTGSLQEDVDLKLVLNDFGTDDIDQEIDAIEFLPDCHQYYATPVDLLWDQDLDGSFETTATVAFFNAAYVDGPFVANVPAQARHPFGGPVAQTTARVTVRNVKPRVTQFSLGGSAGQQLNGGSLNGSVPLVLTNLPVTVDAAFSDPGVLDHQTATIQWGDGSVEPQTAFTTFDEAFGDGTGAVSHAHRYTLPGLRNIVLSVRDDDGGVDTMVKTVSVITPDVVVEMAVTRLDAIIAATSDANARQHLEQAREALAGSKNGRIPNGAIHMIRAGDNRAAIVLLNQSIASLQNAQAAGVNVRSVITLLEQARASVSAA